RADECQLFEDGKPQKIQQFYMVTNDLGAGPDGLVSEHAAQANYGVHRVFVLVFDEGHLAPESLMRVKQGAEDFIREQMSEGDVGGVFVNGGMFRGRLSTDKAELIAGVHTVRPTGDNRQALLATFRQFPRIPSELDATRISDGAREVVDELGIKACNEDPIECRDAGGLQQVENL